MLGTIRDSSGAALPGVTVTLKNIDTGIAERHCPDRRQRRFPVPQRQDRQYRVSAELQGFSTAVAENVTVAVNARQRVELTMQPGAVTESVVITDAAQLLETDSSGRGQVVQRQQIVNLPLNGRSYANLALLTPGVRESSQNGITTAGREAAFNVNGLRNTVNNFLLDGVDNNAYGTSNQGFSNQVVQGPARTRSPSSRCRPTPTAPNSGVAEERSSTLPTAAAQTNFTAICGNTTAIRSLNAAGFLQADGRSQASAHPKPVRRGSRRPIIKDRTFFFLDYEGFRQISKNARFLTLPTLAQRDGILAVDVRDPFTGAVYAAGQRIPMTDFARKVLNDLPGPNAPGGPPTKTWYPTKLTTTSSTCGSTTRSTIA